MAGHVTLTEIKTGVCTLEDLLKINAILDSQDAAQNEDMKK